MSREGGHVESVRKDFAVREDGVIAYKMQEEEIDDYYAENVRRNRSVRENVRVAKTLQDEEIKALASYNALTKEIEDTDRKIAEEVHIELQKQTSREDESRIQSDMAFARELVQKESQKPVEQMSDEELARHLKMKEKMKLERKKQQAKQREEEERIRQEMEALQFEIRQQNEPPGIPIVDMVELPPYTLCDENMGARYSQLAQEAQDEELARTMDDQEDRDRKMAIEQQDEELARHLQEKEKQLAKKRQQQALQRREEMMRLQQQQGHQQPPIVSHPPIASHPQPHEQQQPIQSRRQSQRAQPALPPRAASQPQFTAHHPSTARMQSIPCTSQQPNEAVDGSVLTRTAPSSVPSASSTSHTLEDPSSPSLFAYSTGMAAKGGAIPIVRQSYKRSTTKKK